MVIFWSLVVLVSIAAFLYHSITKAKSKDNLPPAIPSIPVIGGFIWLFHKKLEDLILKKGKMYGPITRINIGFHPLVMINGSSAMKEAGRTAALTGVVESMFVKCLKEKGMPTPDDGKDHRKFYLKNLKHFDSQGKSREENIQVEVTEFLDRIKAHGSQVFDVKRSFNIHTINTIFSVLFGVRMEQDDQEFQEFLKMIQVFMDASNPLMWICSVLPHLADWIPPSLSGKKFIEEFTSKFVALVERSMGNYLESRITNQPRSYTDALMDKIQATTDESSVFHASQKTWVPFITDVLLAAVETTSSTLEWSILFLSQFPDVQKKLQAEIDEVIGNGRCPVGSDRDKMPYFQAVLTEVFRLAPALPFGFHKCTQDTKMMGYDIKQDSFIIFNFFGMHMDPDKWVDPEQFSPERFLDGNQNFIKPELFTFGYGRRSCLGEQVARDQMFVFLTSILQSFDILPEKKLDNLRGKMAIGYRCAECKVVFQPRKKAVVTPQSGIFP